MTNEQINRAVAEELGWKPYEVEPSYWLKISEDRIVFNLPDFCNDHNAAAEMRKAIERDDEQVRFAKELSDLTFQGHEDIMPEYYWALINATPRQQCEAFLRMRGKWIE